jgi:hypothetical protein
VRTVSGFSALHRSMYGKENYQKSLETRASAAEGKSVG